MTRLWSRQRNITVVIFDIDIQCPLTKSWRRP